MAFAPRITALIVVTALSAARLSAQEEPQPPTPEQLAAQERVRPIVSAIWKDVRSPQPGDDHPRLFWEITDRLIAIGPDVVPFLVAETDLMDAQTFNIAAYALGLLGGKDADAALHKALREADARNNKFGAHCKRWSLFGLALLGSKDVMELVQSGQIKMHGAAMVPELPLHAHIALLAGPPVAPTLRKQLDAYVNDPAAVDSLEDTIMAIGRAGDASFVPKLIPLLSHASSAIRTEAADAVSLLAPPAQCQHVLDLLSDKDEKVRLLIAADLERWKPEPCFKGMVGRLDVEQNVEVRARLYSTIVAMRGEEALPILRANVDSPNQFDRADVVGAIGAIGSPKGLQLLRSVMSSADPTTAVRALQAIAGIGGEGAMDTVFATVSDHRPFVARAAQDILTLAGDKRVAPRRAAALLDIVKEPVGSPGLRDEIREQCEALVALDYTDPIADLKTAASVQTDPQIADILGSCTRRLEAIAKNHDDVTAWIAALDSPQDDLRFLAGRRLAEIGTPPAVHALAVRTAKTDLPVAERIRILVAIGKARTTGAADIVERHLSDKSFDAWEMRDARAAAAYAARRLGGPRMAKALRESAVRRDGRDWATLIYLAVLEKKAALPTLTTLRLRRLRYPDAQTGTEEVELERMLGDLARGAGVQEFDMTPEDLLNL